MATTDTRIMLMLVGPPGSGKSTICNKIIPNAARPWTRICQVCCSSSSSSSSSSVDGRHERALPRFCASSSMAIPSSLRGLGHVFVHLLPLQSTPSSMRGFGHYFVHLLPLRSTCSSMRGFGHVFCIFFHFDQSLPAREGLAKFFASSSIAIPSLCHS